MAFIDERQLDVGSADAKPWCPLRLILVKHETRNRQIAMNAEAYVATGHSLHS